MREHLPSPWDGRRTFINMSFGTHPYYVSKELAEKLMLAPAGTAGYREVEAVLGHAPRVDRSCSPGRPNAEDVRALMRSLLYPKVREALARPEVADRLARARGRLEQDLREAQQVGIIVFKSAGNDHARAEELMEDPSFAIHAMAGLPRLIEVCAVDLGGPGREDDRIAPFSSAGDVCAAGVDIPVGEGEVGSNKQGTSFASPIQVESAWVVDSIAPNLTADSLIAVMLADSANTELDDAERAGAGRTDLFAVALLARFSTLDRATIERVRASLLQDPSPENAAKVRAFLEGE